MDVRRLKYFIAVAEERNISRAAARLHISQPPLTRHIQSLEEDLGVRLFSRTNWGVELTQAGALLLEHARNINAHIELASEQIQRVAQGLLGRIDIGVFGSSMLDIVPRILNDFSASHPDVTVVLQAGPKGQQIEALHHGRIMAAFDRYLPDSAEIAVELVSRERVMVALNTRNALASEPRIHVEQLRGETLIGELDSSVFRSTLLMFEHYGFQPTLGQRAVDMISATVMVAGGFGTALVPESVLSLHLPNVVYRPLESEIDVSLDLHCAYRRDETNPLLAEMLKTARAHRAANDLTWQLRG